MSDSRYRETLHAWAQKYIPDDSVVTSVQMEWDEGYSATYTGQDPELSVVINYEGTWNYGLIQPDTVEVCASLGELLTALFAIEEPS